MDFLEKELPNAPDAERAIIGALLVNPDLARDNMATLSSDDFYSPIHRTIIVAMHEMVDSGDEIDPILLSEHLRCKGEAYVTLSTLVDLTHGVPTRLPLHPYIEQVKEKARLRTCLRQVKALIARINDDEGSAEEIAQWASVIFDEIAQGSGGSSKPFIRSFREFMQTEFKAGEVIGFHAALGELTLIQSVTNRGKSTLIRNASIALATGGEFRPIVEKGKARKVLLFDLESSPARFQKDLGVMTKNFPCEELNLVNENFFPVCAPTLNNEPFSLPQHMSQLKAHARRIKPDVIILDTVSAAFELRNENDNAEIQSLMKSLIRLARALNCLIILVHHIGKAKMEEGLAREAAHRGRGASAWADFPATIFNLEAIRGNSDQVIFECAKRKDGENYERVLTLDRVTRWFSISDEAPYRPPTGCELVVDAVKSFNRDVKRAEINEAVKGKVGVATITRSLNEAVSKGLIIKKGHGLYRFNDSAHQIPLL